MQASHFKTYSLDDARIERVLSAALDAARPDRLVSEYLDAHPLPPHKRLFVLGIGKAAESMARATRTRVQPSEALAITKHALDHAPKSAGQASADHTDEGPQADLTILEAGHPLPDERSVAAGKAVLGFVSGIREEDLLLCLISGGGSALVAAPVEGVSLEDLRRLTDAMLRSGADIEEINIVRRRLDILKGGGLAAATRSPIISLILSDVAGDRLDTIASGLTEAEPAAPDQAVAILQEYDIRTSSSVRRALGQTQAAEGPLAARRVQNVILGNNLTSRTAAYKQAALEGFHAMMNSAWVEGEASEAGRRLADQVAGACHEMPRPFCIVAGGETTVSFGRGGTGGRNQEMALAAVDPLSGIEDVFFVTMATDGNDGPTDAAGAVVTGKTCGRAAQEGMRAETYLARHDSYHFFDALGDLLRIGYTGTNVNDITLLVGV
jgi:glycerate 2-kinase